MYPALTPAVVGRLKIIKEYVYQIYLIYSFYCIYCFYRFRAEAIYPRYCDCGAGEG